MPSEAEVPAAPDPGRPGRRLHESRGDATRERILEVLCLRPGLTHSELTGRLGRGWGTLQYHLARLLRAGKLVPYSVGKQRRYFPAGRSPQEMKRIAVLRRGRVLDVAGAILREPGVPQWRLAQNTAMTRKVVRTYLDLLVETDLVQEVERPAMSRYFPRKDLQSLVNDILPIQSPQEGPDEPSDGRPQR